MAPRESMGGWCRGGDEAGALRATGNCYEKKNKSWGRRVSFVDWAHNLISFFFFLSFFLFFFFFCLFGPHLWHIEVPRLGVESELQLRLTPRPQYHQIWATFVTYAAAYSNTKSLPAQSSQGIEPTSSWRLCPILTCWAIKETPRMWILKI